MLILSFFIGLAPTVELRADEPDPIRKEVDKARAARADAEAKAAAAMNAAFDEAIKTVAGLGDLDGVKTLQTEKKAFQESGKVPTSTKVRIAAAEYQKAIRTAQAALEKAYDQAIKESTKALKIEQAEALRAELKALMPNSAKPEKEKEKEKETRVVPTPPQTSKLAKDRAALTARLSDTTWTWGDEGGGARIKFRADGQVEQIPANLVGTWVAASGDRIIMWWPGGSHDTMTFDATFTSYRKEQIGVLAGNHVSTGKPLKK